MLWFPLRKCEFETCLLVEMRFHWQKGVRTGYSGMLAIPMVPDLIWQPANDHRGSLFINSPLLEK